MAKLILPQQQVSPQFASPDVAASGGAQAEADQNMANAMSQSSQILLDIADKNQQRYERLGRVTSSESARTRLAEEMSRMADESDMADPKSLKEFEERSKAIIEEEIGNHDGRQDSAVMLRDELSRMRGDYGAQFFKQHHASVIQRGKNIISRKTGELINLVTDAPHALGEAIEESDDNILRVIGDDLPDDQVQILMNEGRTALVSSAFGTMAAMNPSQVQLDQMNAMFTPEIAQSIDPSVFRQMKISYYTAQSAFDKAQLEKMSIGGDGKAFKIPAMDQFISDNNEAYRLGQLSPYLKERYETMVQRRHAFEERINTYNGGIDLLRIAPLTEATKLALKAQGTSNLVERPVPKQDDPQNRKGVDVIESTATDPKESLYQKAIESAGPANALIRQAESSWFFNWTVDGSKEIETFNQLNLAKKDLIKALQTNKMYAIKEMQELQEKFDLLPKAFGSESAAKSLLDSIELYAREKQAKAYDDKNDRQASREQRDEATATYKAMKAFRSQMQHPDAHLIEEGSQEEKDAMAREKAKQGGDQPRTITIPDHRLEQMKSHGYRGGQ